MQNEQSLFAEIDLADLEASRPKPVDERPEWEQRWSVVRMPLNVKQRVQRLRDRLEIAYSKGQARLPDDANVCNGLALHVLIEKALDVYESHLDRSNKRKVR